MITKTYKTPFQLLTKMISTWGVRKHSLFFIGFALLLSLYLNPNQYKKNQSREIHFAWPAEYIEHLVLGLKLPMADFFWVRFIQDMGYKEHEGKNNLGWSYRMVDAITNLDKRFRIVYVTGGTMLSVEVNDPEGARKIFEKGIENYPHDWSLLYRTGYHYLYELKDCAGAARYLNEAGKYGAPPWVASLAARLYTVSAQYVVALSVIEDNLKRFEGLPMEKILRQRKEELLRAMHGEKMDPSHPATQLCH